MKKILIVMVLSLFIMSCTSSNDFNKAKTQLTNQGYTDIKNTGYNMFCCGEDDTFSTGFKAKDSQGNTIKGCICSGWLKGLTIRFE